MKNWKMIDLPSVGSTNDEAKDYSKNKSQQKFVISALAQTKGRGRRGRQWIGLEGNLFASLGVEVPLEKLGQLVFVVSLALAKTILSLSPKEEVKLKWPNDVLIRGHKISGILLEKGEGDYVIIGIGVNIVSAPENHEVMYPTISLKQVGIEINRLDFLQKYLEFFDALEEQWQRQGFEPIRQSWLSLAANLGQEIKVVQEQTVKRGIFSGIDNNGLLLLERNGKIEKISAGDVFFEIKDNK